MSGSAQAAWQEARSSHFVVYSEDSPDTLKLFTQKLERFDKAMRLMRGLADDHPDPARRVTVYMVRNEDAVRKLYGRNGGSVAGFYNPRASGSVAFVPRHSSDDGTGFSPLVILLHEYAHHFMFSNMGSAPYPGWVVEGYAEFFAPTTIKDDGGAMIGVAPQFRAWGMMDTATMPASRLLVADPQTLNDQARAVFYSRSWLLMHYLMMDADRRKQLGGYLGAIAKGTSLPDAAKLLGPSGKLDSQLDAYVQQHSLHGFVIAPGKLPTPEVALRPLSPAEGAIMPARIASTRGVDAKSAPVVAALARRLAAPYPDDPAVQNVVAEAEFDAGDFDASRAAADRALAADRKSIHALVYEGMARMGAAHKAGSSDPAAWAGVRGWFSKANHLDPENPYPMVLYYDSFGMAGQPATANAEAGLLYAQVLAPFDLGLTLNAARVLLQQGKADDARKLLEKVAYNPHGGDLSAAASKALEVLNGPGGTRGARSILNGPDSDAKTPT
jgi:tetratricopeptide (TPR) repeat protein